MTDLRAFINLDKISNKNLLHLIKMYFSGKRYAVLRGGTRSGKTYSSLLFIVFGALTKLFKICSVVSISMSHLKRGAIRDFDTILGMLNLDVTKNLTNFVYIFHNGAIVEFFSADKSEKLRGSGRDWLYINEVNLISEDDFNELDPRTKKFIFMDFNPVSEFWLNDLFNKIGVNINEIEYVSTYKDNPYLSEEQIKAIESRRNLQQWFKVYGLGEYGELRGVAFYNYIVEEFGEINEYDVIGVDFGEGTGEHAVIGVKVNNGIPYVKELYYDPSFSGLIDTLRNLNAKKIVGDAANVDLINLVRKYNIDLLPSRKYNLVASYTILNNACVVIDSKAENLLKEAKTVEFSDRGRGLIKIGVKDHALDALRYAIHEIA